MKTFNRVPDQPNLIAHHIVVGEGPNGHRTFTASFAYPDGIREFDGKNWVAKPYNTANTKVTDHKLPANLT